MMKALPLVVCWLVMPREVRDACRILGVDELRMLGYRDSGMADTPANQHPEAFCQADPVESAGRLVRIIRELRPQVVVTEPPGGGYGHPDHTHSSASYYPAYRARHVGSAPHFPENSGTHPPLLSNLSLCHSGCE